MMLAFIGILSFHLLFAHLIWHDPDASTPFLSAVKLSLFTTALWFGIAFVLLPLISAFSSNPFQIFSNLLSDGSAPTFSSQVFSLTFGLPATFTKNVTCLFALLVTPFLYGLTLLPPLARRTRTSLSFWLTTLGLLYMSFVFAASNVANVPAHTYPWLIVVAILGALVAFSVMLLQLFIRRISSLPTTSPEKQAILWISTGAVASMLGLILGIAKAALSNIPISPELAASIYQTLATGYLTAAVMGGIAAYCTKASPSKYPSHIPLDQRA